MRVRIGETFHSVFYSPFYVALQRGLFDREGVEVAARTFGDGRLVAAAMTAGEIDVAIGGIMRSLVAYDRGEDPVPVHFARINDRDGFFLLGHSGGFDWPDLIGKRLIPFAEAPTPLYVLRSLLRERGLDPDRIEVIDGLPADRAAAAFRAGEADFLETPAQVVEELLRDGAAVLLRSMGEEVPPLPYSSYLAQPAYLEQEPAAIRGIVRAHVEALGWMRGASGMEIWETIQPLFPDEDPEIQQRAVARYHRMGMWDSNATLPRASFDRLALTLQRGGLIGRIAPYELCCQDAIAREVTGASGAA